jgi:protein phosphatase
MKIQYFTVKGKRKENEDYILSKEIDNCSSIHLIADGMGGYEYGRLVAETVSKFIASFISDNINIECKIKLIKEAIERANKEVVKLLSIYNTKMGTTIGGVLKYKAETYAFWVGDVKIVQVRENEIVFESRDHSLINQLKSKGVISSEIQLGNIRHIVTKSIQGGDENFEPDIELLKINTGDKITICSDGILDRINIQTLAKISIDNDSDLDKVKQLHENNRDNSSMIMIGV